ncbi:MAG: S41 family peptidase [Pseudomonadota bacterium]
MTSEKAWIRGYVNETYLWYQDVTFTDPALYVIGATVKDVQPADNTETSVKLTTDLDVLNAYFNSQRSQQSTPSGKPKDQYHYTYATDEWIALSNAGSSVGFGFQIALVSAKPPRSAVVAYADPGTPATENNLGRGAQIVQVNGANVIDGDPAVLNEGLFSPVEGKQYTFVVQDQGSTSTRTITMTARTVTATPVQNVKTLPAPYADVGYMQFNEHIATAEGQLIAAVNQLKLANDGAGIKDLVLDLRYNGGGLLDIASELAYMIAGPAPTAGKTFEKTSFNDKNPFKLSDADTITPFYSTAHGFSATTGQVLPQLGLSRVFILAGSGTCSASEAIINGLRGVGIQVVLIGNTTCGKPYGFYPQDNCSTTYFTVQFKGVNQAGFGEYADGFVPGGKGNTANNLPGCAVADDLSKPLGDITEARLASALQFRTSGSCASAMMVKGASMSNKMLPDASLGRAFVRENRIYRPRSAR